MGRRLGLDQLTDLSPWGHCEWPVSCLSWSFLTPLLSWSWLRKGDLNATQHPEGAGWTHELLPWPLKRRGLWQLGGVVDYYSRRLT